MLVGYSSCNVDQLSHHLIEFFEHLFSKRLQMVLIVMGELFQVRFMLNFKFNTLKIQLILKCLWIFVFYPQTVYCNAIVQLLTKNIRNSEEKRRRYPGKSCICSKRSSRNFEPPRISHDRKVISSPCFQLLYKLYKQSKRR